MAPSVSFDTPNPATAGTSTYDDSYMYNGSPERFDWKLVGKQEMIVPYNMNGFNLRKVDEVLASNHLNPDHVRWELHRVWEIEATVASGKRHAVPKRVARRFPSSTCGHQ